jgi:hypothetical protein
MENLLKIQGRVKDLFQKNEADEIQQINYDHQFVNTGVYIQSTTNYSAFKFRNDNRDVDFKKVQRIVQSIYDNGSIMCPAIVNDKREVIDGQHRLNALKQIYETDGVAHPYYFITVSDYAAKQMILLNTLNNVWVKPDFLKHHISNNNQNYILFKQFIEKFKWLNSTTSEILFTGKIDGANSTRVSISPLVDTSDLREYLDKKKKGDRKSLEYGRVATFKDGSLKPDDLNLAYQRAYQLEELGKYYPNFSNTSFVKAFLHVRKIKGFSFEELIAQFEKVYVNMRNTKYQIKDNVSYTIVTYRDCLNDIYNFKKQENSFVNLRSVKR